MSESNLPPAVLALLVEPEGFCHPDWPAIHDWARENVLAGDEGDFYQEIAVAWVGRIRKRLGSEFALYVSDNFVVLGGGEKTEMTKFTVFCERARKEILNALAGVAEAPGPGKHVVLLFGRDDDYYQYLSPFYSEGEHARSGGVSLNRGYPHLAMVYHAATTEGTVVHELTRNLLGHRELPKWLNEALAMQMPGRLGRPPPFQLTKEQWQESGDYWNEETIQEFWSGKGWPATDEFLGLYFHLAQVLMLKINEILRPSREAMQAFLLEANSNDAGESASETHLGVSLGDVAGDYFGEGDWRPQPEKWGQTPTEGGARAATGE